MSPSPPPTAWTSFYTPTTLYDLCKCSSRTRLKNRLNATLTKYGLNIEASDSFGRQGRKQWLTCLDALPPQTRFVTGQLLQQLDFLQGQIEQQEQRLEELLQVTAQMQRLRTLPGLGLILAATVALEIGDVNRFASHEHLASYAGTTPRVHSSGDKTRYGQLRSDVNRYLKWAYVEAANVVVMNQARWSQRHVVRLYRRLRDRKGHAKAVGAVARHLAEASFWVLHRDEDYCDPAQRGNKVVQTGSSASRS